MLVSATAAAHHSFAAAYNMEDPISIVGKVVDVRLTNPHSHFFLDVTAEDGTTVSWKFEAGTPSGMSVDTNDTYALINPYYGWYAQDTWRVSRRLTLTFGLRMEYEQGPTERYNRALSYFDPTLELPISVDEWLSRRKVLLEKLFADAPAKSTYSAPATMSKL